MEERTSYRTTRGSRVNVFSPHGYDVCGLCPHLVAVMDSRDDLSEEVSRLPFTEPSALTDVFVQLTLTGIFHHDHNLILILENCE